MRIVFMGTPQTAAHALQSILVASRVEVPTEAKWEIVGVVTQPDRPQGRHARAISSSVKVLTHEKLPHCSILQPEKAKDPAFIEALRALQPDLIVVAAYGQILPQAILEIPSLGCINVHYSLLPELRGAAPIQRAILNGLRKTGVTIMRMVQEMDAGAILLQHEFPLLPTLTAGQLREGLNQLTTHLLPMAMRQLQSAQAVDTSQELSKVTFAPKIETKEAEVDWRLDGAYLQRLIRAMDPSPGAWCWMNLKGQLKRVKLFDPIFYPIEEVTKLESLLDTPRTLDMTPGRLLHLNRVLLVAVKGGALAIQRLQPEGKLPMSAQAFALGHSIDSVELRESL